MTLHHGHVHLIMLLHVLPIWIHYPWKAVDVLIPTAQDDACMLAPALGRILAQFSA